VREGIPESAHPDVDQRKRGGLYRVTAASEAVPVSTFVLVHGAGHGAWCWYEVETELEARGHEVIALDLPGHGIDTTPVGEVAFDDYVQRVREAIAACEQAVVLVGHSMSGMVVTQVAERCPDEIDALVYLTAYLPADGESMIDQRVEGSFVSRNFAVDEDRGVGTYAEEALEELFYADCAASDVTLARSLIRPEPLEPLSTPVDLSEERFGSVPRAYVRCENDRAITPEQQRRTVEERGCDLKLTLESSHSPFFSMPAETADALETAADR
jgi:pimeloyl-ACP methyl ester carboxylesterase